MHSSIKAMYSFYSLYRIPLPRAGPWGVLKSNDIRQLNSSGTFSEHVCIQLALVTGRTVGTGQLVTLQSICNQWAFLPSPAKALA